VKALFAVVCFVMFFAISAAAVIGLSLLGLTLFRHILDVRNGRLMVAVALAAAASIVAAGIIVWSVLPRFDRFTPPGPELTAAEQPALFAEIERVAAAAKQEMPSHVYLVLDCNAFVTERGGFMGLGSRRVMGIGLALLSRFDIDEVRAVIAHEFGHFDGGDTKLGPWVYKTRAAMGRTVSNLYDTAESLGEHSFIVGLVLTVVAAPFKWMAIGYLRLAQAVSRQQEYSADALAARVVGAGVLVSGFQKLEVASAASDAYIEYEVLPLVKMRMAPPFFSGLSSFSDRYREKLGQADHDNVKTGEADPYDSHPPLSARIEALRQMPSAKPLLSPHGDPPLAVTLLVEPEKLAHAVLEFHADGPLETIGWEDSAAHLLAAQRDALAPYLGWLKGRPAAQLRWDRATHNALLSRHPQASAVLDQLPDDVIQQVASNIFVQALHVALADAGYTARTAPGEPIVMVRDDKTINVLEQVTRLQSGELDAGEWTAFWTEAGLDEHPWGAREPKRKKRAADE
jgi:heat shock protein HtpX